MIKLTLKIDEDTIKEYHFDEKMPLTIGRNDKNLICIPNPSVSSKHAIIEPADNGFLLKDLHSKNGTFVNKTFINSHWLENGDIITIGKHTIDFSITSSRHMPNKHKVEPSDMSETVEIETGQFRDMRVDSFLNAALGKHEKEQNGILTYRRGGEGVIHITNKLTRIGKEATSDIVIQGLLIGKNAITLSKRPNGIYLSYNGGFSKPKVNGRTIKSSILLKDFDQIQIGPVEMEFTYDR
ncbi:MAG: FHA domain-containing protein [Deltaproteobacteria bacterium]|nr:FHA domain-containing protein [Deltaproteobacteria bacterium]MBW1849428.1 FHA domain-containing protein [Deltaproteobacteria bacterium]MBW2179470.1 FHA domain-containing protein [Deltaproteobacteria bacterium]MBW2364980.1 FHA domain-containing protein [Deltaproteobacteria bacterium]